MCHMCHTRHTWHTGHARHILQGRTRTQGFLNPRILVHPRGFRAWPFRTQAAETVRAIRAIPAIPANLRRIEQAAERDLAWMVSVNAATAVSATASMPGRNRVRLVVRIEADGAPSIIEYFENWKADAA